MCSLCNPRLLSPCVHNNRGIAKLKYNLVFRCVLSLFDMFGYVSVGVCEALNLVVVHSIPLLTHPLWIEQGQYFKLPPTYKIKSM